MTESGNNSFSLIYLNLLALLNPLRVLCPHPPPPPKKNPKCAKKKDVEKFRSLSSENCNSEHVFIFKKISITYTVVLQLS